MAPYGIYARGFLVALEGINIWNTRADRTKESCECSAQIKAGRGVLFCRDRFRHLRKNVLMALYDADPTFRSTLAGGLVAHTDLYQIESP